MSSITGPVKWSLNECFYPLCNYIERLLQNNHHYWATLSLAVSLLVHMKTCIHREATRLMEAAFTPGINAQLGITRYPKPLKKQVLKLVFCYISCLRVLTAFRSCSKYSHINYLAVFQYVIAHSGSANPTKWLFVIIGYQWVMKIAAGLPIVMTDDGDDVIMFKYVYCSSEV